MKSLKARAIVASEYPEVRQSLAGVVQDELGGMVAGEAENAVKAVALARTLRPDLMVVDHRLPHIMGLDGVRLSRIGGLDAATSVFQELPRARILLVSHIGVALPRDSEGEGGMELCLYGRANQSGAQLEQQVIFTALREKAMPALRRKVMVASERGILVGGLALLGGLGLLFTFLLAPAGVALAAAGVGVLLLSLAARAVATAWPRRGSSRGGRVEAQVERDDIEASLQRMPCI
ncbi:MAG: hypothetical protein HY676_04490 [Chloroflexi bacterium]|nr:hypothetical protein [Chloroflexota bacterium]